MKSNNKKVFNEKVKIAIGKVKTFSEGIEIQIIEDEGGYFLTLTNGKHTWIIDNEGSWERYEDEELEHDISWGLMDSYLIST